MLVNFWKKFLDILPGQPRIVGTVTSGSGGVYQVALVGGGNVQVTSLQSVANGTRVFVQGGVIVSTAPALTPFNDLEV